jgi:pyrroline-5-carboxylate reductase
LFDYSEKSDYTEIIHDKIRLVKALPNTRIAVEAGIRSLQHCERIFTDHRGKPTYFSSISFIGFQ